MNMWTGIDKCVMLIKSKTYRLLQICYEHAGKAPAQRLCFVAAVYSSPLSDATRYVRAT